MTNSDITIGTTWQRQGLSKLAWGLLAAMLSSACDWRSCSSADCADALFIELKALDWVSGAYVASITESERTFECSFEKGTSGAGGQAGAESEDASVSTIHGCEQTAGDPAGPWDTPGMSSNEYGDITIVVRHAAKTVPISVRRDGALLLDAELTPSYTKRQPNGPECGPTCFSASETLTLRPEGG